MIFSLHIVAHEFDSQGMHELLECTASLSASDKTGCKTNMCLIFPFSPTPAVSWVKRNGEIPSGRASFLNFDKTLRIMDVSEADAGEYRCFAKNRLGSVHHTIRVTVNGEHTVQHAPQTVLIHIKAQHHRLQSCLHLEDVKLTFFTEDNQSYLY